MSRAADELLWVLSAHRELDWAHFCAGFEELFAAYLRSPDADRLEFARLSSALLLDALGHAEAFLSGTSRKLVAAPPVLAELPLPGLPRAVLCGARSPRTLADVMAATAWVGPRLRFSAVEPANPLAPTIFEFEAESTQLLQVVAERLDIQRSAYPTALALASGSAGLTDYMSGLHWIEVPELNWKRSLFDPGLVRFVYPKVVPNELHLVRYDHPIAGRTYRLWRATQSASVDVLWGRYAVFSELRIAVMHYDDATVSAVVRREAPLPRILARVLTLCSGQPSVPDNSSDFGARYDRFEGVPPDVFNLVARKVGQPEHRPDPARRRS